MNQMPSKRTRIVVAAAFVLITMPLLAYIPETNLDSGGNVVAVKWADSFTPITWRMNPTVSSNVTGDREQADVFRNSFQQWADVTTSDLTFTPGPATDTSVLPGLDLVNLITTNVSTSDFNSTALGLTGAFSFTSTGTDGPAIRRKRCLHAVPDLSRPKRQHQLHRPLPLAADYTD
jgi:hypothetical protein